VWWRRERDDSYRPLTAKDIAELEGAFAARGRAHLLPAAAGS